MPVAAHAFTCQRKNWAAYFDRRWSFGKALSELFGSAPEITLSRSDVRNLARERALDVFVVATLLWGYPSGMRGTHVVDIRNSFRDLKNVLQAALTQEITWTEQCARVAGVHGVGLSTYTKFLTFLGAQIDGHVAMILDSKIVRLVEREAFSEMAPIREITYENGLVRYPEYLGWIHSTARELDVPTENLELFLFEFGGNLKDVTTPVS